MDNDKLVKGTIGKLANELGTLLTMQPYYVIIWNWTVQGSNGPAVFRSGCYQSKAEAVSRGYHLEIWTELIFVALLTVRPKQQ